MYNRLIAPKLASDIKREGSHKGTNTYSYLNPVQLSHHNVTTNNKNIGRSSTAAMNTNIEVTPTVR